MLYQMLSDYIEHKLYTSVEEVHEKIVVYDAVGKLTEGEFMTLYRMLYPIVEHTEPTHGDIMLLDEVEVEEAKELHVIPQSAIDILYPMLNAKIIDNVDHKANVLYQSGQLDDFLYDFYQTEFTDKKVEIVEEVIEDVPTILPEIGDTPTVLPEIEDVPTILPEVE